MVIGDRSRYSDNAPYPVQIQGKVLPSFNLALITFVLRLWTGRRRRSQSRGDQLIVVAGVARGRIPIEKKRREGTRRNKKENQDGGFHCQTDDGQPAQRRQRSV